MTTALLVAIISGAVALASAALSIWGQARSARLAAELQDLRLAEERRRERETAVSRYREPLARAAYDLQSRLYNILERQLIQRYYDNGDDRERSYVVNNTVFLVAQYFAWTEIIRRDMQYLDLGADAETRRLAALQDTIYSRWQIDRFNPLFRVFAGEQRAIGERLIHDTPRGSECMGYAAFLDYQDKSEDQLLAALRADVRDLSTRLSDARPRLVALQNAMIDLLELLDANDTRFPKERKTKVAS